MKPHRRIVLPILIGMVLLAFAISFAQTSAPQTNQKKQAEACCAMDSCCCHGDSCAMKTDEKTDSASGQGCCGDSCKMKMKHDAKNHASEGTGCCGDSCKMTAHDPKNPSAKHECCAGQMANNMTAKHDMKNHDMKNMKNHDMKNGCCCCGDSCDTKVKQTAN